MTRRGRVRSALIAMTAAALLLGGCSREGQEQSVLERLNTASDDAPDEFMVLPRRPLVLPEDLATLPEPQPGETSRADLTPISDLQVALSGRTGQGVPSSADAALLSAVGGVTPNIRAILAEEDADWRDRHKGRLLERLLLKSQEGITYRAMILDADAELRRLRALGIRVPQLPEE